MTVAIKRIHNLQPHLNYFLHYLTLTLETVLRASSTKPMANMAACMCKGKGTSLQTPTVI